MNHIVTVQLRASGDKPASTIRREWTAAEDAADAIFLTVAHLSNDESERVKSISVTEEQA